MARSLHCSLLVAGFGLVLVPGLCLMLDVSSAGRLLEAVGTMQMIASQTFVSMEDFDALSAVPHARAPKESADLFFVTCIVAITVD